MPVPVWKTPMEADANSWGYDKEASPPWLMVEHRVDKILYLDFASGKEVKSTRPLYASIKDLGTDGQSRVMQISGRLPGSARIEVRDPRTNRIESLLDVSVKSLMPVTISFFFVEGRSGATTDRTFEEVGGIIRKLNQIYTEQTNIKFRLSRAEPLKVDINLDDVVDAKLKDGAELLTGEAFINDRKSWKKIFSTKGDRSAQFNVYFVPSAPANRNDLLFYEDNNCVIEDGMTVVPEFLLAHAIGRMFGCPPTSDPARDHHLMFWGPAGISSFRPRQDNFIPKDCANRMNPVFL